MLSAPTPSRSQPAKLYRQLSGRMVGGVARGLAQHLGVDVLAVRAAFVVLAFAGASGIALYAAFWIFVPAAPTVLATERAWVTVLKLQVGVGTPAATPLPVAVPSSPLTGSTK